jgi:hypothetical protein
MTITRPTSRQLQGHFNALRPRKSNLVAQTIDIAPGNYGVGKVFPGIADVSDPSWASSTAIFYIYIDKNESLILNDQTGFPALCTKIGRVIISSGVIIDVEDERAEVNGLLDAYQVAFDDTAMHIAFPADDLQQAIVLLDAYVSSVVSGVIREKYIDLDVGGGIKNGLVRYSHLDDAPAIEFPKRPSGVGRVRYSISVPKDWANDRDIVLKIFWSVENSGPGNVRWRLSYRRVTSGNSADMPMNVVSLSQAAPGTINKMIDTGDNLIISSSNVSLDDILILNVEREYSELDTYDSTARMHLARVEYIAR